ncbi:DNA polymerase III subunit delta [Peptoniphilus sp. KCTC 25270]|uniref:DNA polymerase III subunit delta n=1 Tax=Peptoniphilus sp. KCTC 25270 TaxID=2897414 RepID=UPI001E610B55|nr:DNA polymerase III subunit delta [Peptoniphilus sp. KCTC 25270]MCD1146844.1 DNA polymerase III subunit delta [Peptoniphilus sp. KCTC 25270]
MELIELYKSKNLHGTYLFHGEEKYLMEDVLSIIEKNYTDEMTKSLNWEIIEIEEASLEEILSRVETMPFMGNHRVVVVKNIGAFIEKEKPEDEFYDGLLHLPETSLLLLVEQSSTIKKNQKLYKRLNKVGRSVEFAPLKHNQLVSFVEKYFQKHHRKIQRTEIERFIARSGYEERNSAVNLYDLQGEMEKLVGLSTDEIFEEMILESMESLNFDTIFQLLDSIAKGNLSEAMETKKELLRKEEPIQRILFMVIRQVRLLLGHKLLEGSHYSADQIQNRLGIKSYEGKKIALQSRGFSVETLKEFYTILLETDLALKRSEMENEMALDLLFVKMCNKKS